MGAKNLWGSWASRRLDLNQRDVLRGCDLVVLAYTCFRKRSLDLYYAIDLQASLAFVSFYPRATFVKNCFVVRASSCTAVGKAPASEGIRWQLYTKVSHGSLCWDEMLCCCVFGYIPIDYPCFDQMFHADRLTGDVMNMHGVTTVLCFLAGICNPHYWELHTFRWQIIVWPVVAQRNWA